jgi:hypothetical protein
MKPDVFSETSATLTYCCVGYPSFLGEALWDQEILTEEAWPTSLKWPSLAPSFLVSFWERTGWGWAFGNLWEAQPDRDWGKSLPRVLRENLQGAQTLQSESSSLCLEKNIHIHKKGNFNEKQFTQYPIHPFQVCNPVLSSNLELCNHHH